MAGGNVVGVTPIDQASSPVNGTRRSSWDASGPYTGGGHKYRFRPKQAKQEGFIPDLNTSGGAWVKSNPIRVDGIGSLHGANYVTVDQPR
jgi:hypothetical protein